MASRHMRRTEIQLIPLGSAYLCQNCQLVGNVSTECPGCGSQALLCLAGVMDREEPVLTVGTGGRETLCVN